MPYKDPEKRKEFMKQNYHKNKEKRLKRQKELYELNKEEILQKQKQYYHKNKETILQKQKEYKKEYLKTTSCIKSYRISNWKSRGVVCENFDELYDKYMNTTHCEKCNIELSCGGKITNTTKCLDHSHNTGEFRNILCNLCNIKRREDNF